MTWRELKEAVERYGVTDDTQIEDIHVDARDLSWGYIDAVKYANAEGFSIYVEESQ